VTIGSAVAIAGDGEPLAYRVAGAATGTPMLTVHGLVSSVHQWMFFTPYYATRHPVVSWEYRGHGGQRVPRNLAAISVAQFADDAGAVWRATGLAPAVVVGLSFGVQVALEIWRRHPGAVRALVLICGTPGHLLDRVSSAQALRSAVTALLRSLSRQRGLATRMLGLLRGKEGQAGFRGRPLETPCRSWAAPGMLEGRRV